MGTRHARWTLAGVVMTLALAAPRWSLAVEGAPAGKGAPEIELSFKLDPRLMGGSYGGERWVSPPTYTGTNAQDTVDVRAAVLDAKGKPTSIAAEWKASDPEMVVVSPPRGDRVKITVRKAGESTLRVSAAGGAPRELAVQARIVNGLIQIEIRQTPAAAPKPGASPSDKTARPAPAPGSSALAGRRERLGYALGMNLMKSLRHQSIDVDEGQMVKGIHDVASGGKTLLTEEEVGSLIAEARREAKARRTAAQGEKAKEIAERTLKDGEAFLARNASADGVITTKSGLQYKVLKAGEGKKPGPDDTVICHYSAALTDGTEFDSSHTRNRPATLPLRRVIPGWSEALQLMPVGSKWQLFVPAGLAYGERGLRGRRGAPQRIPPNAALVYEVELLAIQGSQATPAEASESAPAVTALRDVEDKGVRP